MGPNGSGKSTLANAIMGHPALEVTEGTINFKGEDITEADPDERSRAGPLHGLPVPGRDPRRHRQQVPADDRQRPPRGARRGADQDQGLRQRSPRRRWSWPTSPRTSPAATSTTASPAARRSGWRCCSWRCCGREIAVLDETDSGLDIDALRTVAEGVNRFAGPEMGVLIITHYQRILHMVKPDFVHVMYEGRIVKEGGPELVERARGEGLRLDPRGGRGGAA